MQPETLRYLGGIFEIVSEQKRQVLDEKKWLDLRPSWWFGCAIQERGRQRDRAAKERGRVQSQSTAQTWKDEIAID